MNYDTTIYIIDTLIIITENVYGCTDDTAANYDPDAEERFLGEAYPSPMIGISGRVLAYKNWGKAINGIIEDSCLFIFFIFRVET